MKLGAKLAGLGKCVTSALICLGAHTEDAIKTTLPSLMDVNVTLVGLDLCVTVRFAKKV